MAFTSKPTATMTPTIETMIGLRTIAANLANRVNQQHYLESELLKVYNTGFKLGVESASEKWIGVDERLPEIGQNVLIIQNQEITVNREPLMAHYCEDGFKVKKYVSDGDRFIVTYWREVTHWQPLPEPPKQ